MNPKGPVFQLTRQSPRDDEPHQVLFVLNFLDDERDFGLAGALVRVQDHAVGTLAGGLLATVGLLTAKNISQ